MRESTSFRDYFWHEQSLHSFKICRREQTISSIVRDTHCLTSYDVNVQIFKNFKSEF